MEKEAGPIGRNLDPNDKLLPKANNPKYSVAKEPLESRLWRLTDKEREALDALVAKNARRSVLDGLDPALSILKSTKTPDSRTQTLEFLAESTRFALAWGELGSVLAIAKSLTNLANARPEILGDSVAEFQALLGREEILDGITAYSSPTGEISPTDLARLRAFLDFLPPLLSCAKALVGVYPKILDRQTKAEVLRAIAAKAPLAGPEIALAINGAFPPATVIRLIEIIPIDNDRAVAFVAGLSKNVYPAVREKAAAVLLESDPSRLSVLSHLLTDPDPGVNKTVYSLIGRSRHPTVEKILLQFLRTSYDYNQPRPEVALLNCYRCLGLCAVSPASAEFASRVLLKKDFKSFFGLGVDQNHRKGAALALLLMPPGFGQEKHLSEAAKSLFRDLRKAYQEAELQSAKKSF
jgi:hypothetical protein